MDSRTLDRITDIVVSFFIGGILANEVVTLVSYPEGNAMTTILRCNPGNIIDCMSKFNLYFLAGAVVILLGVQIAKRIWWNGIANKITAEAIPTPSRFPSGISLDVSNNTEYELERFTVEPLEIKILTWPSNLNATEGIEHTSFDIEQDSIREFGKAWVRLVESDGNENDGYKARFLVKHGGYLSYRYYISLVMTNKDSSDNDKQFGDVEGAIYQIFIGIRGMIGDKKVFKIFKGRFYHLRVCKKWKRHGNRWIQYPPRFESTMQWIDFSESSTKELKEARKKIMKDRKNPSMAKAEIRTKEEFFAAGGHLV